ncbi:uncharacterized protein EI97DRAFT_224800 [Westerdykella ornata]|uniref:Uncharacterized protein n=1 Tax=Westerdykella ornata TaxID=318751 RepID=A0A6A6JSZ2_WESOR|nr:uncharacterized protein EI97DRAFT_224800 [Westerdykella ornata]KAF2278988.1 hypothetical protein EI97DRAFT_224800 [Westerdykella ornata]
MDIRLLLCPEPSQEPSQHGILDPEKSPPVAGIGEEQSRAPLEESNLLSPSDGNQDVNRGNTECLAKCPTAQQARIAPGSLKHLNSAIPLLPTLTADQSSTASIFCTYCVESGKHPGNATFAMKHDWLRHVHNFHFDKSLGRRCAYCSQLFGFMSNRNTDAVRVHFRQEHQNKVPLLVDDHQPCLYACGFKDCYVLCRTNKEYYTHVCGHMQRGETGWSFDSTIRALLRHPQLFDYWQAACAILGPQCGITSDKLQWDYSHKTERMRRQLQYFDFSNQFGDFLQELFLAGIPHDSCACSDRGNSKRARPANSATTSSGPEGQS